MPADIHDQMLPSLDADINHICRPAVIDDCAFTPATRSENQEGLDCCSFAGPVRRERTWGFGDNLDCQAEASDRPIANEYGVYSAQYCVTAAVTAPAE
jgi:hypothetical protein